jgi:adenylate cyclase class 2
MNNTEIEIQVKVDSTRNLVRFLNKKAKFLKEERQIDEYFSPSHRDFAKTRPVNEWLRLRKTRNGNSITYKNWHHDKNGKSHHCDEYETVIEKVESINKIFEVLNFKTLAIVNKTRKIWRYKQYEISLDKIKGLGNFVEIEYKGKEKKVNPKKITDEMIDFLKSHNVGKVKRNYQGYPFLLMFPKEARHEEV